MLRDGAGLDTTLEQTNDISDELALERGADARVRQDARSGSGKWESVCTMRDRSDLLESGTWKVLLGSEATCSGVVQQHQQTRACRRTNMYNI
jgi:hypothetical protein